MKSISIITLLFILLTACQPKEANHEVVIEKPKAEVNDNIIKADEATEPENEEVLMACTKEAKQCSNGKTVGRNPKNKCEFDPCDIPLNKEPHVMCTADVNECPDGSYVSRDHSNKCKFKDCPDSEQ